MDEEVHVDDWSLEWARARDARDPLRDLRKEYIIPSRRSLGIAETDNPGIYLCGNSLGLQPGRTRDRVLEHLESWADKGVRGHFESNGILPGFVQMDARAAELMAPIIGAQTEEVAVMETLTANLHLLMASFYRPTSSRCKILIEARAFPSDHQAVTSWIKHCGYDPVKDLVCLESETISTEQILATVDQHHDRLALILLPGVQYYTGQAFDIEAITRHAQTRGIVAGWDMAHAAGNIPLRLHEWEVDFAVWCNYKYLNAGPGAVASLFVHEKHGMVQDGEYRPRLAGWWGGDKGKRFAMGPDFVPIPGAQGFQVGNPSSLAISSLIASLEVFALTSMTALREKSVALTGYLDRLLRHHHIRMITPTDPNQRGAQLSLVLEPEMLDSVMAGLESQGIVVDERKPNVIRVAPTPMYNTFEEVWRFVQAFCDACNDTTQKKALLLQGRNERGWSLVE